VSCHMQAPSRHHTGPVCLQDINAMLTRCPYAMLYSIHHMGERMMYFARHGLQSAHMLAIARDAPKVLTRRREGASAVACACSARRRLMAQE